MACFNDAVLLKVKLWLDSRGVALTRDSHVSSALTCPRTSVFNAQCQQQTSLDPTITISKSQVDDDDLPTFLNTPDLFAKDDHPPTPHTTCPT